jgi:hypothetical protein
VVLALMLQTATPKFAFLLGMALISSLTVVVLGSRAAAALQRSGTE